LFQVLVEFGESRKLVSLKEGNSIVKLIKDAFGIEGEILLQKFDKEWQEFIDLEGNAVVEDKAKLSIISQVCYILQELNIQLFL